MAILIRTSAEGVTTSGGAPTVAKPAPVTAGDLIILMLRLNLASDSVIAAPDGFSLIDGSLDGSGGRLRLYAKIAGNAEPDSYAFLATGTSATVGLLCIYSDAGKRIVLDAIATTGLLASSVTWTFPGVTTAYTNTLLTCFGRATNSRTWTAGAGMSKQWPGATHTIFCMTQTVASAGATGTREATLSSSSNGFAATAAWAEADETTPPWSVRATNVGAYAWLGIPAGDVGVPVNLRAVATSERSVYLEFDDRLVRPDATGYNWQVSFDGVIWNFLTSTAIGVTGYTHAADPETTYFYRVQATPGGEWSNVAQATTPPAVIPGGRALWIDVEDSTGRKLGEGPLLEITRCRVTKRLDRAGDFDLEMPLAYRRGETITTNRYVRVHARLRDQAEEVFYGPVEKIGRRMSATDEMRTVNGPDIARELARAKVWDKTGAGELSAPVYWVDYADAADAPADLVTTYAPDGWIFTGVNLVSPWSGRFFYDSVLNALGRVGEETGEHFRIGSDRSVEWLGRLNPGAPSGVRAVHGVTLEPGFEHDEICLVTHVEEVQDAWEQVTRVHASGGEYLGHPLTTFEATTTPAGITDNFPSGGIARFKSPITHILGDGTTVTLTLAVDLLAGTYRLRDVPGITGSHSMTRPEPGKLAFSDATVIDRPLAGAWVHYDPSGMDTGVAYWPFFDWYTGSDLYYINNPFITQFGYNDEFAVYLRNQTLEGEFPGSVSPIREAHISFSQIVPTGVSIAAEVAAANALLNATYNWMRTRARPQKFYRLDVTGLERLLEQGDTIRVSVHRFFDGRQFFNIEADFLILEASYDFDQTGIAGASLLIGSTDRYPASDVETISDMVERAGHSRADAGASSFYVESGVRPASKLFGSSGSEAPIIGDRLSSDTAGDRVVAYFAHITDADMADEFGASIAFAIEDSAGVRHIIGFVGVQRSGADDTGRLVFTPMNAGLPGPAMIYMPDGILQLPGYGAGVATFDAAGILASDPDGGGGGGGDVAAAIWAAVAKTTPVGADVLGLVDTEDGNSLKKLSWANIKATLQAAFDSVYAAIGHNHDGVYSLISHLHDDRYSLLAHNHAHNSLTGLTTGNPHTQYSLTGHNHDGVYSLVGHNHDGVYSLISHNHAHNNLTGLATGDAHTQYTLLAGRPGGQNLRGGTASGETLTLRGSAHATSGGVVVTDNLRIQGASTDSAFTSPGQIALKQADNNPYFSLHADNGTRTAFVQSHSVDGFKINNQANTPMGLYTNNAERVRITAAGAVHINSPTPVYSFDVATADAGWQSGFTNGGTVVLMAHGDNFGMFILSGQTDSTGYYIFQARNSTGIGVYVHGNRNVGIGGVPAASAKLDIQGTTGALLLPRLTTAQRNALTATNGMIIFNVTDGRPQTYAFGAWNNIV